MNKHAAVWIDHKEARIFHIHPDKVSEATIHSSPHDTHKHAKGTQGSDQHPEDTKRFFHEVARSLDGTDAVLIVGPSTAKLEFVRYLHRHDQALEQRIVGIETVDHPTDGQIIAYTKKYFRLGEPSRSQ